MIGIYGALLHGPRHVWIEDNFIFFMRFIGGLKKYD